MIRTPWLPIVILPLLAALACSPGADTDGGPQADGGDKTHDAGPGGDDDAGNPGGDDDAGNPGDDDAGNPGDDDAGNPGGDDDGGPGDGGTSFDHPSSDSVPEVIFHWGGDADDKPISARMKDGSTLTLVDHADFFEVSPDGERLGYAQGDKIFVKSTSGGPPTLVFTTTDTASFWSFRFSPDGSVLFVTGNGYNGIAKADGSFQSDSLGIWGFNAPGTWFSPDGSVVIAAAVDGLNAATNARMFSTADGSEIRILGNLESDPQWAPDSSAVYVAQTSANMLCLGLIRRYPKSGEEPTTVKDCTGYRFALSPDGTKLAYLQAEDIGSSQDNLFLADAATGENALEIVGADYNPKELYWLPDGSGIVYFDQSAGQPLRRVNPDGTNHIQLAETNAGFSSPDLWISPDGSTVAYELADAGTRTLYVADPDTADSSVEVLPDNGLSYSYNVRWTAGEPCLAFLRNTKDTNTPVAHVVAAEGACSLVPTGTSRGAVPASFDADTQASEGVSFAGGAVLSRIDDDPGLYREDASGSSDIAPAGATYIEDAVAIDRFVGTGSDEAPERVLVQRVTSFQGF